MKNYSLDFRSGDEKDFVDGGRGQGNIIVEMAPEQWCDDLRYAGRSKTRSQELIVLLAEAP